MTDAPTTGTAEEAAKTDEAGALARRLLFLQEQEKAIDEEKQSIGRRLAAIQTTKAHDYGGVTVEVHAGRRTLDAKRFEQAYPLSAATAAYYVPKPQPLSKLQQLIPGGVPDECTKTGQPWVTASVTEAGHE
ncbi:hypothetical protein PSRA_0826 [Pseudoscardovia radai]|uniref:Uncharacterized protein n=1 Tax=Pseudoscardovia radai TaxID=987066 RepID=A0A261EYK4_9BIFI|nr:hypothetical protein [Pseudoscardovia radai]OZG51746.1 hypothetical protein PSRA_0826 [Pseudoscardovia radai]